MKRPLIIGIAGGTCSGKTTITKKIAERFAGSVSVIYHDNYYKAHHDLTYEQKSHLNYDHPDSYDTWMLTAALKALGKGQEVACPVYDYTIHDRSDSTITIKPAPVILVEGILILADPELCREMDIKVFVDTDADVRILRRIIRDVKERKRSLESIIDQYLQTVKPMHEKYVEPSKQNADIIIPEGGRNKVALELLLTAIKDHLEEK